MYRALSRSTLLRSAAAFAVLPCATVVSAEDLPTIRIAGPQLEGLTVVYYGMRSGLFRRHGVNVEVVGLTSGAAATAALLGGSVQVAWPALLVVIRAHLASIPLQIIAPGNVYRSETPAYVLSVKSDSPIRSASDLNGKTVATQSVKDMNWAGIAAWVDSNGGDSRTIKNVELPISAVVPAIVDGRVDAANVGTPYMEQGLASGTIRMLAKDFDIVGKRFLLGAFVSTPDAIAANKTGIARFVNALHEATVYTNTHLPETVDLVASFTGMDPAMVRRSTRTVNAEYIDLKDLQPLIDMLSKYKVIDRSFPVEELISSAALRGPHA